MENKRTILDTNLWISFLISKKLDWIDELDEKDNFLLNLAMDSKADFLITGDSDLLALEKIDKTKIETLSSFIEQTK